VSEHGRIEVEAFSIDQAVEHDCFGSMGRAAWSPAPVIRARVDLVMDEVGLARFLDAMEAAVPGFRRPGRSQTTRPLPEATRALPAGPIDAEFVDE
jgi:hypothetical protein